MGVLATANEESLDVLGGRRAEDYPTVKTRGELKKRPSGKLLGLQDRGYQYFVCSPR